MPDPERGTPMPPMSATGNDGTDDRDVPPRSPTAGQPRLFTPQKPDQFPIETIPPVVHPNTPGGRPNRLTVNRRLLFDSRIGTSATPPENKQPEVVIDIVTDDNNGPDDRRLRDVIRKRTKMQISTLPEMTIGPKDYGRYRPAVESLLARGFAVQKLLRESVTGDKPLLKNGADDDGSSVFECLSLIEGSVYGVHVVALRDKEDTFLETAKTLADVGPHPYIVPYFSNWTDGRFHYTQTERYPENLWTPTGGHRRDDCRTVLEHVSCALHHLHVYKKYAHNLVNRRNIYRTTHCGGLVYKLAGFHGATKLTTAEDRGDAATAILADVKSLCSTVADLLEEQRRCDGGHSSADGGHPSADGPVEQEELWSFLLSVTDKIEMPAGVIAGGSPSSSSRTDASALTVWRWCCKTRWQTKKQDCPTGLTVKRMETKTGDQVTN